MARERKAPELHLLSGNPSKLPAAAIKSASRKPTVPSPPTNLKGEAFAEWCRVTLFLEEIGHIEVIDYAALVVYCTAWAQFDKARVVMDDLGPLIEGRDGGLVKNPAAQVMRDAADIMLKYGSRLGFTPKDRVNLGVKSASTSDEDGLGQFLAG